MTQYKTILTTTELDEFVKSIPDSQFRFFPTNKIIYAKRKGEKVFLKGLFFTSKGTIKKSNHETIIEIETKYKLPLYILLIFLIIFFSMFLFADEVTINGNSDPSFLKRLGFVLVAFIVFSIPVGIIVKLKSNFEKRIERELKLKKTTANNTLLPAGVLTLLTAFS